MTPAEYYKIRLEHTLQHLQQATRLIYLVNGAVLTTLYFVAKLDGYPHKRSTIAFVLLILALVNLMHALFIRRQGAWYRIFDNELAANLSKKIKRPTPPLRPRFGGTTIYATLHYTIAATLVLAAALLLLVSEWP